MSMDMEKALLAHARPQILANKAKAIVRHEVSKGCRPEIADSPVALEPVYQPIADPRHIPSGEPTTLWTYEQPPAPGRLRRLRVWISPRQTCDWVRSELLLKQFSYVRHRVAWEVLGNRDGIVFQLLCHVHDLPIVRAAFSGQFEQCALSLVDEDPSRTFPIAVWERALFYDFYPPPPYSHLLTRPDELERSPYAGLISTLAEIAGPCVGIYQVVFAPVLPEHNWHQNVQALLDLEFSIKLLGGVPYATRFAQQAPSGDLRQMAMDVEVKSHNDKPFFAAALRVGVVDAPERADRTLRCLALVGSLLQHGGRPLNRLTAEHYRGRLPPEAIANIFSRGLTYRPGFLVNSWELTSMVHVPPPEVFEHLSQTITTLETLSAPDSLATGTPVGVCTCAGVRQPVCIPASLRAKHAHLIGRPGMGKSSILERMVLHDAGQGHGVAVLDPHGTLVQRLLALLPEECVDRVIFLDPGDPDWVPIWNPFLCPGAASRARIADDMVRAFKSFIRGWGDRLEHLLRHAFFGVLHLPRASLLDVSNLLRSKSEEGDQLRLAILEALDNEVAKLFWREDFSRYRSPDLTPPQHKLSKLLAGETVSLMLSQPDSLFSFRDLMETGKILLVDLSRVGPEVLEILGCFILSLLHVTALARGTVHAESRLPFHIFCDEAHRFVSDAVEDLIAETRKFGVSLTLAHQYLSQFTAEKMDALSSVGARIIFQVDTRDAAYLKKDLQGLVELDELIVQEVGQAIARIGNHVVRVETLLPLEIPQENHRDRIIARSRQLYCRPTSQVQRTVRERRQRRAEPLAFFGIEEATDDGPIGRSSASGHKGAPSGDGSLGHGEFDYDTF